jgi:PAS domain S-box-containing protein
MGPRILPLGAAVPHARESRGKPPTIDPHQSDELLRQKATELEAIFESLSDGLLIVDDSPRIVEANQSMLELLGCPDKSDLLGSLAASLHPRLMRTDGAPVAPDDLGVHRALRTGESMRGTWVVRPSHGGPRWLDGIVSPIRDADGRVLGASLVVRDVSEQYQRQRELELLARASDLVLGSTAIDVALAGLADLGLELLGDCCAVYLQGGSVARLVVLRGHDWRDAADLSNVLAQRPQRAGEGFAGTVVRSGETLVLPSLTDEVVKRQGAGHAEVQLVRRLGLRSLISTPLRGSDGPLGALLVGYARDGRRMQADDVRLVEELARRATMAVEQSRHLQDLVDAPRRLEQVLNAMDAGLIILGGDGRAILINATARDMIGLSGNGVGMTLEELLLRSADDIEDPRELDEAISRAIDSAEPAQGSFRLRQPSAIDIEWVASPVRDERGVVLGQVVVWLDVTHIRAIERIKDELAGELSDALRTPLHSISTYAVQALRRARRAGGDQLVAHGLEVILRNARQVSLHVNDLVDAARFDPDALELTLVDVEVRDVVQQAIDQTKAMTTLHRFRLDVPAALPQPRWDPDRARQSLLHVLTNAAKYSPDGGQINVKVRPQQEGVVISVRDRGLGIPPDEQERVFDRFYRIAGQPAHRRIRGNGLGLFLVRSIVEAHGGTVWIESTGVPGDGTTVFILLPWNPATPIAR